MDPQIKKLAKYKLGIFDEEQEVSAEELRNMPLLDVAKGIVEIASVDDWKAFLNSVRSTK